MRFREKPGFERQNWKINCDLALDLFVMPPEGFDSAFDRLADSPPSLQGRRQEGRRCGKW